MSDQTRDSGFTFPKRWSDITEPTVWPATKTLLDAKQQEVEHFLYAAPDSFPLSWWTFGSPMVALGNFSFGLARHERMRGRYVAVSWFAQFTAMTSTGGNILLALPRALWPQRANAAQPNNPAVGSSGRYTSAHIGTSVDVELADYRSASPLNSWVIDTLITDTTAATALPNGILAGHVIFGLFP